MTVVHHNTAIVFCNTAIWFQNTAIVLCNTAMLFHNTAILLCNTAIVFQNTAILSYNAAIVLHNTAIVLANTCYQDQKRAVPAGLTGMCTAHTGYMKGFALTASAGPAERRNIRHTTRPAPGPSTPGGRPVRDVTFLAKRRSFLCLCYRSQISS